MTPEQLDALQRLQTNANYYGYKAAGRGFAEQDPSFANTMYPDGLYGFSGPLHEASWEMAQNMLQNSVEYAKSLGIPAEEINATIEPNYAEGANRHQTAVQQTQYNLADHPSAFYKYLKPALQIASVIPSPIQPLAAVASAGDAAMNGGSVLPALIALAGIPGVSEAANAAGAGGALSALKTANQANNLVNSVESGNILGALASGVNLTGTGGEQIGDTGYNVADALKAASIAKAVESGNYGSLIKALAPSGNLAGPNSADFETRYFAPGGEGYYDSAVADSIAPTTDALGDTPSNQGILDAIGYTDKPLPDLGGIGGLPVTPEVSDVAQTAPTGGLPVTSEGGGEETAGLGFQGPNGPPTEDIARRQAEEYARYLDYLTNPTATPDYSPQQMQISQENIDSYNKNLQDIWDNRGGFTSQWQTAGSDRIMINDDGSGIGMNENGETYPLSSELVDQMVRNGQLNTAESGYVAATGGTGNLPGGSAPSAGTGTPSPTGGLPTTPTTPGTSGTSGTPGTIGTPTSSSPFGMNWLDTSPQMLKASTSDRQGPAKMAQLRQLYGSLTPEMQSVFADQGISAPEADMPVPEFADGGTTQSTQSILDGMTPKFAPVPKFLDAAPFIQPQSRMLALRHLRGPKSSQQQPAGMAQGGLPTKYSEAAPRGHKPEFITGVTGYYAQGGGTGQSDDIPAMLHDGDYVIDADAVAAFGDGSSKAGAEVLSEFQSRIPFKDTGAAKGRPVAAKIADGEYVFPEAFVTALGRGDNKQGSKILDEMRENLREHKRSAPTSKIPPKAKSPLDYLKTVKG